MISVAVVVAGLGCDLLGLFVLTDIEFKPNLALAAPLVVTGWLASIAAAGGYGRQAFEATAEEYRRVVNSTLVSAAVVGATCFVLELPLSRGWFVLALLLGVPPFCSRVGSCCAAPSRAPAAMGGFCIA